ncbi:hypothetical protein Tco_1083194 [Tanacetum coccineum]
MNLYYSAFGVVVQAFVGNLKICDASSLNEFYDGRRVWLVRRSSRLYEHQFFKSLGVGSSFRATANVRLYERAVNRYFGEVYDTFRQKMLQNLNQLEWQLEKHNLRLRRPHRKNSQTYRVRLLQYLDELDKLVDERVIQYGELLMKEREVKAIKEIEKRLSEQKMQTQERLVTKGAALEASLVTEGITLKDNLIAKESTYDSVTLLEQHDESSSSGNDAYAEKILVETVASSIEHADIRLSYDSDTVSEVHHDTFENVFAHRIQNHEQPESIPDTYVGNKNNSDIISDIPNIDPVRDKEEHDSVDDVQCLLCFIGQTAQTFHMLLPNEDNFNTGTKDLGSEIQNNVENPFILNKAKELTTSLYNIDEIGKDLLSDHKIISEEELKCEGEKRLKVKQRKSLLSCHGFVYGETQFEEPTKVPLKRRDVNLKINFGTSSTEKL